MRRIILGSALALCALLPAFSQTTCQATVFTPNLNLSLPALGTKNWNLCLNPNFQTIDSAIARLQSPFLGPWSNSTVYTKGSFVSFNNVIYISSIFSNFNNTPSAGSTAWQLFFSTDGGGGGGSCGPGTDTSNTNCGTNNQTGLTTTPPANVTTYGSNNVDDTAGVSFVVAIGNDNYEGDPFGSEVVAIGDSNANATGQDLGNAVLIGNGNMKNTVCHTGDYVGVGDGNLRTCPTNLVGDVVDVGSFNSDYQNSAGFSSPNIGSVVAIGNQNDSVLTNLYQVGTHSEIVAIGDQTIRNFKSCVDCIAIGDFTLQSQGASVNDIVAIGDVAAEGLNDGASADVFIGLAPGELSFGLTGSPTETIGIGDSAADNSTGDENIAIGDSALDGGAGLPRQNTGNNNIAIGQLALAANTTGSENTAIGTNAGCSTCSGGSNGANANRTGSHNVWIGDQAGQSVASATAINSSIAIGFRSQNAASNEARFGSLVATFDTYLFGTIHTASATSPTALAGTLVGTNNGGAISGLSAATSVTVTFAGGAGFQVWNSCTANASAASTPVAVSALSLTAVTFSFPSLTGSLYFHCDGN